MRFLLLLLLCCYPFRAGAAEAVSGDVIKLDDGRFVRLSGIKAVGKEAQAHLQSLITHQTLLIDASNPDRYGRLLTEVYVQPINQDKIWLQAALLQAGEAFVYPPSGSEPQLADLMKLENEARRDKRGIWNDANYADLDAAKPKSIRYGHFAFVRGQVLKAERIKNMFYLNFGANWRTDFTIAIAAHDLHLFENAGIDPQSYEGKTVRVRGWVKSNFGPMITVTHPSQIEVLGEAPVKP